jgi:hypothetical protein
MSDPLAKAKHYRVRAHECLTLADLAPDLRTQAELVAIAEDYLKLASIEMSAGEESLIQLRPFDPDD